MFYGRQISRVSIGVVLLATAACGSAVQTTSGSQYLQKYEREVQAARQGPPWVAERPVSIDGRIYHAANVDPVLTFPARIGIARIDDGRLSGVPETEAEAWSKVAERLGPSWGEFLPISPLVVAMAGSGQNCNPEYVGHQHCLSKVIQDIRQGAARQHVDAVLIYEVFGKGETSNNPLAITKLAIIGYWLPTESQNADGYAQAVLLDVRNGYTYGYASAVIEDAAEGLSTLGNRQDSLTSAMERAKTRAALELALHVEEMARELRWQLAEKRSRHY